MKCEFHLEGGIRVTDKLFDELIDTISSANENLFSFFQIYPNHNEGLTVEQRQILMVHLEMSKEMVVKNKDLMFVNSK